MCPYLSSDSRGRPRCEISSRKISERKISICEGDSYYNDCPTYVSGEDSERPSGIFGLLGNAFGFSRHDEFDSDAEDFNEYERENRSSSDYDDDE